MNGGGSRSTAVSHRSSVGHVTRSTLTSSSTAPPSGKPANCVTSHKPEVLISNGSAAGAKSQVELRTNGNSSSPPSSQRKRPNGIGTPGHYVSPTSPRRRHDEVEKCKNGVEVTDVDSVDDLVDHPFFRLAEESRLTDSLQIVSAKGTVRGVRNRVKAGIAAFIEQQGHRKQKVSQSICVTESFIARIKHLFLLVEYFQVSKSYV